MVAIATPSRAPMRLVTLTLLGVGALMLAIFAVQVILAQVEGDRGIAAVAASSNIEVGGIEIDVPGKNAEDARQNGWREAQRLAWKKIGGSEISDGQLQGLVAAVVIEQERISARRYVARLGIIFDRQRAGSLLGRNGQAARSAPMLLMPITVTAGTATVYETRNPWQQAWAEYQAGSSRIDYVRPSGAGGDSLLLTAGQQGRRSRIWWRNILDQFGASDVLMAIAELDYQWPGGPVKATFTARYGPDNRYLDSFILIAASDEQMPKMMRMAVERMNRIFVRALAADKLKPDPTLNLGPASMDPAIQQLIELGRQADAADRADRADRAQRAAARRAADNDNAAREPAPQTTSSPPSPAATGSSFVVQFATPDSAAFDTTLAAVRSAPGVRGAAISSTAIGGTSVMNVSYGGTLDGLAGALRGRGFTVRQGSNALAISR